MILICSDCYHQCTTVEETFDYAGTHCTGGMPGTHHAGVYVSDCCGAETVELRDFELEHNGRTYRFSYDRMKTKDRRFDWDWWAVDWEDEHSGTGESLEDCIRQIQGE